MSTDMINVCLIGQAKVGTRWLKAGHHEVTAEEKTVLEEAGLLVRYDLAAALNAEADAPGLTFPEMTKVTFNQDAFNAAVSAEANKLAQQAFDGELGKIEAELKNIVELAEKEKAELLARSDEAGQLLLAERQKSADLAEKLTIAEAEIAALKAAPQIDTTQSETVAKTTAKKGAASTAAKG